MGSILTFSNIAAVSGIAADTLYVATRYWSNLDDGGGGLYIRSGAAVTHAWSFQAGGAYWQIAGDTVTPQQRGIFPGSVSYNLAQCLVDFEASPYGALYLSAGQWFSQEIWRGSAKTIEGPGAERLTYHFAGSAVGDNHKRASNTNPRARVLRDHLYRSESLNGRRILQVRLNLGTGAPLVPPGAYYYPLYSTSPEVDTIGGGIFVNTGADLFTIPAGVTSIRLYGYAYFDANANGARFAMLGKLVAGSWQIQSTRSVQACSGGNYTVMDFDFGVVNVSAGEQYRVVLYQTASASITLYDMRVTAEVISTNPLVYPGKRLKVFQGTNAITWDTVEAAAGGYLPLLRQIAEFDVLALSHVEAIGAPNPPNSDVWLGWPNSPVLQGSSPAAPGIVDSGYKNLRRLIKDAKDLNPDLLVFGYVSGAADAPLWNSLGNPVDANWSSSSYQNLNQWISEWFRDSSLPIDGLFVDHFASQFMSTAVRDYAASLVKQYGGKLMVNSTKPDVNGQNVIWAAECPYLVWGDYIAVEGYGVSSGIVDYVTANVINSKMGGPLWRRGVWLAAIATEAGGANVNVTSANNVNTVSVFNFGYPNPGAPYRSGWCYEYNNEALGTIGPPAI